MQITQDKDSYLNLCRPSVGMAMKYVANFCSSEALRVVLKYIYI